MISAAEIDNKAAIVYSCYYERNREGEQFVPEHVLSFQLSGTLVLNDGHKEYAFEEGDFRFVQRNRLVKFNKQPPENGEFRSLSIYLSQELLSSFSREYGYTSEGAGASDAVLSLPSSPLLKSYLDSLLPYENATAPFSASLLDLKLKEAIMILLQTRPDLKDVLFDFDPPGKIDLAAFMNKNFHFNVRLSRFAYLTGRSLAAFKRDFEKIFHTSPGKWLQQRRLEEAYHQIKDRGRAPSDVYLDLGFEDLSHFSFAFKKTYGVPPSRV